MNRNLNLDELKSTVKQIGEVEEYQYFLALTEQCYIAFFAMVEKAEMLKSDYQKIQAEVLRLKNEKGTNWLQDLYLVLIVKGNLPPDAAVTREITNDRYVCRKFVLYVNSQNINDAMSSLPFWPPDKLFEKASMVLESDVKDTLESYDRNLIADLFKHRPGAKRVFEKIRDNKYALTGNILKAELFRSPQLKPLVGTKIEALDITDFRGIRRLRFDEMPLTGDVVIIYGPNGVGKTSIADAVDWVITGQVKHLHGVKKESSRCAGSKPDPIVNVFSENGEVKVKCILKNQMLVERTKIGSSTERLIGSSQRKDDRSVIDYVVGSKAPSNTRLRIEKLRDLFRSSHMLSQHDIRLFLEEADPKKRFDILTNMIGAEEFVRFREKVTVILRHLYSHFKALEEQCKSHNREYEDIKKRLDAQKKELKRLSHFVTLGEKPNDAYSGANRPPIPIHFGHHFRSNSATCSGANRPPLKSR